MLITVTPYFYTDKSTSSIMRIDGEFECFTLEDTFRQNGKKIFGQTCIPAGIYDIILRNEGGKNSRYKTYASIKDIHRGMLWLQDVEKFEWIYIHIGNFVDDTLGCILVGESPEPRDDYLQDSKVAYLRLYKKIISAIDKGESIRIRVNR